MLLVEDFKRSNRINCQRKLSKLSIDKTGSHLCIENEYDGTSRFITIKSTNRNIHDNSLEKKEEKSEDNGE